MINTTLDGFNTPNSITNNSCKNIYNKSLPIKSRKKNIEIKEIIKNGIEQCDEEIKNLSKIEELLLMKNRKKGKIRTRYNSRNKVKFKLYKTIK